MPATRIYRNARVWTVDPARPEARAVGVREETIVAVGGEEEVRAAVGPAEEIDLGGRLVLPGFIDGHVHLLMGGAHLCGLDLRDANPEEFTRRVRAAVERARPGAWITGGRWDNTRWPGGAWPHRDWIDPFSADVPVFVKRTDGHIALANSHALALAGITAATPAPSGGAIDRAADGRLTGILRDAAMDLVSTHVPPPTDAEREEWVCAALDHAAAMGVVGVNDMGSHALPVYQRLLDRGALTCRIHWFVGLDQRHRLAEVGLRSGFGNDWLRIGGVKAFADGSLGARTALMAEPYRDDPSTSGLAMEGLLSGELEKDLIAADRAGLQLAVHAIGDRANELVLDIAERMAQANGPRDRRMRIEHAQHLRPQEVERFARLGVVASVQPPHVLLDALTVERTLGPDRAAQSYPFRSLLASGARVVFGTDWPVVPLNPLEAVYAAVTRAPTDGSFPGGWTPQECVSVAEAVRCYTLEAAWAQFQERRRGSLTSGKLADFIVLSHDVLALDPLRIREAKVEMTVVGGRVVFGAAK